MFSLKAPPERDAIGRYSAANSQLWLNSHTYDPWHCWPESGWFSGCFNLLWDLASFFILSPVLVTGDQDSSASSSDPLGPSSPTVELLNVLQRVGRGDHQEVHQKSIWLTEEVGGCTKASLWLSNRMTDAEPSRRMCEGMRGEKEAGRRLWRRQVASRHDHLSLPVNYGTVWLALRQEMKRHLIFNIPSSHPLLLFCDLFVPRSRELGFLTEDGPESADLLMYILTGYFHDL